MAAGDTNQGLVGKFHKAFGVPDLPDPDRPNEAVSLLRAKLIAEESREAADELFMAGFDTFDRARLAKELADLLVVTYGTAEVFGIDLDWAFRETMASNMTKLDSNGKPIYREDGKVLKGPNYRPPNMRMVVHGDTGFTQAD